MFLWQLNPYAIPLLIGAIPTLDLAAIAWRHRSHQAARYFALFSLAVACLMITYGLELMSASLPLMMIWVKLEYIFLLSIPVLWFLFVLVYSGYEHLINRTRIILLFLIPAIHLFTVWTNEYHGLNWQTVGVQMVGDIVLFDRTYGPAFWIDIIYLYCLAALSSVIMIVTAVRSPHLYRGQITPLMLALSLIWVSNLLTIAGLTPLPKLDLTPFGYALACGPAAWSLFRFRLLDIMPAARGTIIKNMSDAVLVLDARQRVIDANPAAQSLLGFDISQAAGLPAEDVLSRIPELILPYQPESGAQSEVSFEVGGSRHAFDLRMSPLYNQGKQLTGRIVVLRDITRIKQAEETARKYAVELEQRNSELDAFSRTVAHDLKTPLTGIVGSTDLLLRYDNNGISPRQQERLEAIHTAAFKLNSMINDLLLLASLRDVGNIVTPVSMNDVVQAAADRYQAEIGSRGIHLFIAPDLPPALGQAGWIEEVFANLISNAIKYIGRDNPHPQITIRGCHQNGMSRYEVQDNGLGIAPDDQDQLFDQFTRFHQGEATGLGLGLSIFLRIVTRLNGKVGVESEPGKGSTFWFALPMPMGESVDHASSQNHHIHV